MPDPFLSLVIAGVVTAIVLIIFWPDRGLFWRWQRANQMTTRVLHEDALKHLFNCESQGDKPSLTSLVGALSISPNQVAEVLKDLQTRELLKPKGTGFYLTPSGRDYALRIIRAHRLYERYLSEETGYDETEWHSKAHEFEHHLSPDEIENLAARLGNPTHDPHGDPIPTADGEVAYPEEQITLTNLPIDTPARIIHLEDEPEVFYAQLVAEGLHIGQEIRLTEDSPQRLRFWAGGDEHVLAPILAASITVVPITDKPKEEHIGEPLTNLKPGDDAQVVGLSPRIRGVERRRLMDLGILPGTLIQNEMASAGGDPIAYRIRGALIALRKSQAELITVCRESGEC
jgi:DtxR family Mn-dependent transcriptional regulator